MTAGKRTNIPPASKNKCIRTRRLSKRRQTIILAGFLVLVSTLLGPVGIEITSNETKQFKNHPSQQWKWQCCVDPLSINPMPTHPYPDGIQAKNYSCPTTPSNFSWYFGPPPTDAKTNVAPESIANYALDKRKWNNASYTFVGGSTTRQMYEQLLWEMPEMKSDNHFQMKMCLDKYMFKHISGALNSGSDVIDLRRVAPCLAQALTKQHAKTNYVIFHLG
jgi:hypothetical protein